MSQNNERGKGSNLLPIALFGFCLLAICLVVSVFFTGHPAPALPF